LSQNGSFLRGSGSRGSADDQYRKAEANLGLLQIWVYCKSGFIANLVLLQIWAYCKSGFIANLVLLQIRVYCESGFIANPGSKV
jgi:hypothetical protein